MSYQAMLIAINPSVQTIWSQDGPNGHLTATKHER